MAGASQDLMLTPQDLAGRWGCSTGWLANLRSAGRGPTYRKIGRYVRYRLADVMAYEEDRRVVPEFQDELT